MENKKNTGLIVLVVVLTLVVVGLAGFIVYDKVLTKENNVEEKTSENTEKNTSNVETESTTTENSYELFAQNLKEEMNKKYDNNNYSSKTVETEKGYYTIDLKSNGDLYINMNNKFDNYKIASNVLNFYIINVGQNILNTLYFINEDGSVSDVNIENNIYNGEEIKIRNNIDNLKNIVTIQNGIFGATESGAHGPIFIDINGNIYSDNLN